MTLEDRPNRQILREETIIPKKIRVDTAKRSVDRLLTSLHALGAEELRGYFKLYDAPPFKRTYFAENNTTENVQFLLGASDATIPDQGPSGSGELVVDSPVDYAICYSTLFIDATLSFNGQPVRMHTAHKLADRDNYRINLVMPTAIPMNKEVLLESLPSGFTTVAFAYDFTRNPKFRERLSAVTGRRVPAEIVGEDYPRSNVKGEITSGGIDTQIQLTLQNPNPDNHLKCYEVEIFDRGNKNVPQTTDVAPETIWQPKENHFCMAGGESYPFIPVRLSEIARLKMEINCEENSPKIIAELISDLPLSIDGTNQWCVKTKKAGESLGLFFKPEWGENNTTLVFSKVSSKRIFPKEIHSALVKMDQLRKSLTKKLPA